MERVDGYKIQLSAGGETGNLGTVKNYAAFSKEAAEEFMRVKYPLDTQYSLILISFAQFVELLSGEIVDNGPQSA